MSQRRSARSPDRIAAIVLAAGASQRMGRPKALLPFDGEPLVAHVVRNCVASVGHVTVVTGAPHVSIKAALDPFEVSLVHNSNWDTGGMISSIKAGLRALPASFAAAFIVLGDQPMVRPSTFEALIRMNAPIARPSYRRKHGHPILINALLFGKILALPQDSTLKQFIDSRVQDVVDVPVDDPAVVFDIDTPADYQHALQINRSFPCETAAD